MILNTLWSTVRRRTNHVRKTGTVTSSILFSRRFRVGTTRIRVTRICFNGLNSCKSANDPALKFLHETCTENYSRKLKETKTCSC